MPQKVSFSVVIMDQLLKVGILRKHLLFVSMEVQKAATALAYWAGHAVQDLSRDITEFHEYLNMDVSLPLISFMFGHLNHNFQYEAGSYMIDGH